MRWKRLVKHWAVVVGNAEESAHSIVATYGELLTIRAYRHAPGRSSMRITHVLGHQSA